MSGECELCGEHALDCDCKQWIRHKKLKEFMDNETSDKYGPEYWFKFRDSIYDVGNPYFSIVSNNEDEHPDKNVIRISDCKFNVFIDVSCGRDRQDALERATALCNLLNAEYPFHETSRLQNDTD